MIENLIVIAIITLCAIAVGRRFYRQLTSGTKDSGSSGCGCDCTNCPSSQKMDKIK